jgi:hypothetical protein
MANVGETVIDLLTVIDRLTANEYTPPTRSAEAYWVIHQRWERQPFQPHWDTALTLLQEHRFRTQAEFAGYFKRNPRWATEFKTVVIRQKVMTLEEWKMCFPKRSIGRPIEDPRTFDERQPQPEPTPLEDEWSGLNIDGIEELIGAVLARLTRGEFSSEEALMRFYKCCSDQLERLRNRIIEGGLVADDADWKKLFPRWQKRRAIDVPASWSHLALDGLRGLLKTREQKLRQDTICDTTSTPSN